MDESRLEMKNNVYVEIETREGDIFLLLCKKLEQEPPIYTPGKVIGS